MKWILLGICIIKFLAFLIIRSFAKFFDNRFYLILLVVVLMRFKYTTYRSMWMSALVNIPGTFLHELMHFLVGALFNAKPCNFTLFPKKRKRRLCDGKRRFSEHCLL